MLRSGRASAPKCVLAHFLSLEVQMTSRQARRDRREAERKARKAELKLAKAAAAEPRSVAQARAEITRANAQHATGPRSVEGKLGSSRNSLKHGLASGTLLIPGEDAAAFEALRNALIEEHQPANETETLLVHEIAQSYWLTQRAIRLQNECFTFERVDQKQLSLLLRYQTTHDRAFYKALNTLVRVKKERLQIPSRFVSQTVHPSVSPTLSPEQSDGLRLDEAAVLSQPKTP